MRYTHRYIARIILEAETPLFVGSGETSLLKDALVQKDYFGFPMIQGTSLTGVLRHALDEKDENWNSFFGFQDGKEGEGSKVKISSASLILHHNKVAEGYDLDNEAQKLLDFFDELPTRQHVRISDKGTQEDKGLFDNEVVYQGCRFIFEMEVKGDGSETTLWNAVLNQLKSPLFRLGQGTRNGYGKLKVNSCKAKKFNLQIETDFEDYLAFKPSLNSNNNCLVEIEDKLRFEDENLLHYCLGLKPDSYFIFGSGYGDDEVNNTPLQEKVAVYDRSNKMIFEQRSVIPGTSVKGAISHRTSFHYNKLLKQYADEGKGETGKNNDAVYALFGAEAGQSDENERTGKIGKVIINDQHFDAVEKDKIFNHVAIDRFTGGAIDGALFSEKVSQKENLQLDIWVDKNDIQDDNIIKAFENALIDICKGLLPLGGMTTKGHGIFTGHLSKNQKEIFDYEKV